MKTAALCFPNQLFKSHPALKLKPETFILVENSLFFYDKKTKIGFHRQKISLHLLSMQAYEAKLKESGVPVEIVSYKKGDCELKAICSDLALKGFEKIVVVETHDFLLNKRLVKATKDANLNLELIPSPNFINSTEDNTQWRSTRKRWHMADFYQWQRKRLNILMDNDEPTGGQWSFDEQNRKKLPVKLLPDLPQLTFPKQTTLTDVNKRIDKEFNTSFGLSNNCYYPTTHAAAKKWLDEFLEHRFELFGAYEDAIEEDQNWLYHSILTPMLNIGLLEPKQVIDSALKIAEKNNVPINSVEGFIRQIIGWREFMSATYTDIGVPMRTSNHWEHTRAMPKSMYDASTGIVPVDNAISRILETGYCHHIERLMVLGGFMFLCEIEPDDIYRWFMEMFVDSYDWVMVPNVYAMSQHADGGSITTKPYFSGSNYIIKMSHYKKGEWSEIWDALFWRWIIKNKAKLENNYRWSMMCKNAEKMDKKKKEAHLNTAESFLATLK